MAEQKKRETEEKEIIHRLKDILLNAEISDAGPRTFYFVTRENRISCLNISVSLAQKLQKGQAAIVETPGEPREIFRVVSRDGVLKLQGDGNDCIRFFNR